MFLSLEALTRTFGTFTALHDVTLRLEPGRIGLLGPNGAGKSTLLKILMGLLPPSSGNGTVLGLDVRTGGNELRRKIGFMPEADALVPGLTGLEYVTLAGELYGMPRRQAQRRSHEVLSYLALDEARFRKVEDYSLGMKQRVKLAQALVHDPAALLVDEPTSGLDPAGRDLMLNLIRELGRDHGKTIVLSTHLLADVQAVCDQVVVVAGGRVRSQGTTAAMCAVRTDRFRVKVQGEPARFLNELAAGGATVLAADGRGEFRVAVPKPWSNWMFFRFAEAADVTLRSVVRDDESVEEFFLRTVSQESGVRGQVSAGRNENGS